jgi:23S rRNA (uracil1939-C5)-methyltransferase
VGRKKKLPILENIEIIDAGAEGKAIAKHNDMIVFVNRVVPGDIVDVQVSKKRKKYLEAYPIKFHKYSADRVEPKCEHFGVCGGCKWQNLPYEKQLFYKNKQVIDSFERLGKIEVKKINYILAAPEEYFYRNKLEYTFSNKKWLTQDEIESNSEFNNRNALGFHVPKMFDKIVDVFECHLQANYSNEIKNFVRNYALKNNLEFYDIRENTGLLRNLVIRNTDNGELMVILIVAKQDKATITLLDAIHKKFPQITSLNYIINTKLNDSYSDQEVICYKGKDHLMEKMGDLQFKVSPKSFYQTNSKQAYNLYNIALKYADIKENDIVYDLYTGTGTIANFVAGNAKKVIGIEYVEDAIKDAKTNSEINNINNTEFFAGDMKDVLNNDFINKHGKPNIIIVDPPRAGMHTDVVNTILNAEPEKIVYVSCNPATQARDIALMKEKYETVKIQPVDMFPHTHHVENVALLIRK